MLGVAYLAPAANISTDFAPVKKAIANRKAAVENTLAVVRPAMLERFGSISVGIRITKVMKQMAMTLLKVRDNGPSSNTRLSDDTR